jgi:AcrR family transcriptional regulator
MTSDNEEPKRGRGRPRREGADERILATTLELLRREGYGALTVDAVAEMTGIAKTTIYRRWPSKGALVAAAMAPVIAGQLHGVDTGAIGTDLQLLLGQLLELLNGEAGPIASGLIGESQSDPSLIEVVRSLIQPHRSQIAAAFTRAIGRGELRPDADPQLLCDLATGAIWTRLLLTREPLTDDLPGVIATLLERAVRR